MLGCIYTSEDKAEYGVSEGVPDEDWVPIRRDLPKGRLVLSHGLIRRPQILSPQQHARRNNMLKFRV